MDEKRAKEMIGKVVLVGVTVRDRKQQVLGHEQYFGTILRISEAEGMIIRRGDTGEEMWLPPALERYEPAEPGEYRLKASGQVVVNPDFVSTWTRYPPTLH